MAHCSDAFLKSTFINQAGPLKYPGTCCLLCVPRLWVCVCSTQERLSSQKHFLIIASQFLPFPPARLCVLLQCCHNINKAPQSPRRVEAIPCSYFFREMQMIGLAALQENKNKEKKFPAILKGAGRAAIKSPANLDILLVAVLRGRPGVVLVVEAGLSRQPAAVVEGRGGTDLVVADLPRLHAQRDAAAERWENTAGKGSCCDGQSERSWKKRQSVPRSRGTKDGRRDGDEREGKRGKTYPQTEKRTDRKRESSINVFCNSRSLTSFRVML